MSEMASAYARCLHLERERERKHRKYTACAASDARAFHYEAPQTHGEDDEELDYGWDVTDEGDGAEAARSFEERRNGSYYTRRIKIARVRLSRKHPELLEVFNLVVKNGKNRRESIAELAARGLSPDAARTLYWKHLKKNLIFLQGPIKTGVRTMFRTPSSRLRKGTDREKPSVRMVWGACDCGEVPQRQRPPPKQPNERTPT